MTVQELQEIMTRKGLTVRRLSRGCGYSKDYIKRVLRGAMPINRHFEEAVRELLAGGKKHAVVYHGTMTDFPPRPDCWRKTDEQNRD